MTFGRVYTGTIMLLLVAAGISFMVVFLLPYDGRSDTSDKLSKVLSATIGTASLVFLLNVLGLWFGKKSYGATGTILSFALIGFGLYWLLSGYQLIGGWSDHLNTIIFAVAVGTGGIGVLGSLGAVSAV
jgi:hypothetical protein